MSAVFAVTFMIFASLWAMADVHPSASAADGARLKIVATIFPQYDFTRVIAGDRADVTMLVRPGTEIHSYDPSPQDILSIRNSDVFIYIGGESDAWVDRILESVDTSKKTVIKLIDCVKAVEEEIVEGMQPEEEEEGAEGEEEETEYDEHIWTSPLNAIEITRAISDSLGRIDPANAEVYSANADRYVTEIRALDDEFRKVADAAKRKKIVFADRFPFRYLTDELGLKYSAAFPGCSTESDVSAATMAYLVKTVESEKIPVVYVVEQSAGNIARTLAEQTGASILTLHSCERVTQSDIDSGATYLSLMRQNVESLKQGLN
jgi:zinc transport system substrate-binding protein